MTAFQNWFLTHLVLWWTLFTFSLVLWSIKLIVGVLSHSCFLPRWTTFRLVRLLSKWLWNRFSVWLFWLYCKWSRFLWFVRSEVIFIIWYVCIVLCVEVRLFESFKVPQPECCIAELFQVSVLYQVYEEMNVKWVEEIEVVNEGYNDHSNDNEDNSQFMTPIVKAVWSLNFSNFCIDLVFSF